MLLLIFLLELSRFRSRAPARSGRLSAALLAAAASMLAGAGANAANLPVAGGGGTCVSGVCLSAGQASAVTQNNRMDITQTTGKAIFNWAEFNIAAGNTVNFSQPDVSSLAINRIFQGSPSQIFGTLTANGQIYLINQNGILFGRGSQVNVGSLTASSLNIDDAHLGAGIIDRNLLLTKQPSFAGDGRIFVLDENGQVVHDANGNPIPVRIAVEEGAKISASPKGSGLLAFYGQQVENAGELRADSGQVILAAGQKVYLEASDDPNLRGLLVEVDAGGSVWNKLTGSIATPTGNTTLMGLAVNQDGRVSATTTTKINGSIRLLARDTLAPPILNGTTVVLNATNAGAVTLGSGSRTEVLPDASDGGKAVDEQTQPVSTVEVVGRQIDLKSDAEIRVPGGTVTLTALPDPSANRPLTNTDPVIPVDPDARIRLEAGSVIDVSGSVATAPVSQNFVEVELRANELKDSPAQRDGALRGKKVTIDVRKGTPLADVSGAVATVQRDVLQRTAVGGTVTLESQGDIAMADGARIDVSGGAIQFQGGVAAASQLLTADGKVVDISQADPSRTYVSVINPTTSVVHKKWGITETISTPGIALYQPGYVEGKAAGTVQFAAPRLALNGQLLGNTVSGPFQRAATLQPAGGRLIVGIPDGQGLALGDYKAPSVSFVDQLVPLDLTADGALPDSWDRLWLPTGYLTQGGFGRTEIYSNGAVDLDLSGPLTLAAGSSFSLLGDRVTVGTDIRAPASTLTMRVVRVNPAFAPSANPTLTVSDGVRLNTDGLWVNDNPVLVGRDPVAPLFTGGGVIDLGVPAQAGNLVLGANVSLSASAGAQRTATGAVTPGPAGRIALQALGIDAALETGAGLDVAAFGFGGGGTLTIGANQLRVIHGDTPFDQAVRGDPRSATPTAYLLADGAFNVGGFQTFSLAASGGQLPGPDGSPVAPLSIAAGANVAPEIQLRTLNPGYDLVASGADVGGLATAAVRPDYSAPAASLSLALVPHAALSPATVGPLVIEDGAAVRPGIGGTVSLTAPTRIEIDGIVEAPSGTITARLKAPPGNLDIGFDRNAVIALGPHAVVSAAGSVTLQPSNVGLLQGTVGDGGTVMLTANRGAVELAAGSRIDVSGTAAPLDLPPANSDGTVLERRTVASRGGTIRLTAPENITLDGTLRGAAGDGAGSTTPEGGLLVVGISRLGDNVPPTDRGPFPTGPRQIVVSDGAPAVAAADGTVLFDTGLISRGGFADVTLQADDSVTASGAATLAAGNHVALETANLAAEDGASTLSIRANSVALGPRDRSGPVPAAAADGGATLDVQAGLVELFGNLSLQGFGSATLAARDDLRATGLAYGLTADTPVRLSGSLAAAGSLTLRSAQLYPTSLTDFAVTVAGTSGGILNIESSGATSAPPLSADGTLSLTAGNILQAGTLRAPLGQISLLATDGLELAPGSITSTSAAGQLIPFGRTEIGTKWVYEGLPGNLTAIGAPLRKKVTLQAGSVAVDAGAVVDVSGGGDLYGYEFVPGPGGSRDALAPAQNPTLFAIFPDSTGGFGTFDTQEYTGSSLRAGDSVSLAAVPGLLPAGTYALFPARYALLPGAVLVQAVAGVRDLTATQTASLPDGTPVVAGYRTVADTGIRDSRSTGFAIRPGSYARQLAEYDDSFGNTFFPTQAAAADQAAPLLARDAGDLAIDVRDSLTLDGLLNAQAAAQGRGARVDLSATNLLVSAGAPGGATGAVEIADQRLNALGAESLLLGGRRTEASGEVDIEVAADTVTLAPGAALSGPEILLTAKSAVALSDNASLTSTGAATDASSTVKLIGSGGSALVRVAGAPQVDVQRDAGSTPAGDVTLGAGSVLQAAGSITVDAGGTARSFGSLQVQNGSLSLASNRILLGADPSLATDGLALSETGLRDLGPLQELRLSAGSDLTFAGAVTLGGEASPVQNLRIDTPVIHGGATDQSLTATRITLANQGATALSSGAAAAGQLELNAQDLVVGPGTVTVDGLAGVNLSATRSVLASGDASLNVAGDLTIRTPMLAGQPGAALGLEVTGALDLASAIAVPAGAMDGGLGARVDAHAAGITISTRLSLPSGSVRLISDGDVSLLDGGVLDLSGRTVPLGDVTVATPGGTATIVARTGTLAESPGAVIDVSGAGSTDAGRVGLLAGGETLLQGTVQGRASAGAGGSFELTTATLGDFSALNTKLNAGGFSTERSVELHTGDLTVASTDQVLASDVTLAASGGSVFVAGQVGSGTGARGSVTLAARDDVAVQGGAVVAASGERISSVNDADRGGTINLMSTTGDVSVASGATLRFSGTTADSGTVHVRAAASGSDAQVSALRGTLEGVAAVVVEPTLIIQGGTIDAPFIDSVQSQMDAYAGTAVTAIHDRLVADAPQLQNLLRVQPGVEIRSDGPMTLGADWTLNSWRFNGEPGFLTLRSGGDLNLANSLSDGFSSTTAPLSSTINVVTLNMPDAPTWSFALTAGADLGSALPWAVAGRGLDTRAVGNLLLADGAQVRTGTGSIGLYADGDISLGGAGALVYTAGTAARASAAPAPADLSAADFLTRSWLTHGGDITIAAGRDFIGAGVGQLETGWTYRVATSGLGTQWAVATGVTGTLQALNGKDGGIFRQGVAALGGGDVQVRSGRDVINLFASIPTTGAEVADPDGAFGTGIFDSWGGGNLSVGAGRDVVGGALSVWAGNGRVSAQRSITSGSGAANPMLSFGQGRFELRAARDLGLAGVVNPTTLPPALLPAKYTVPYFYDYAPTDSLELIAMGGDLAIANDFGAYRSIVGGSTGSRTKAFAVYPANLQGVAAGGDILIGGSMNLLPAATGSLELLAAGSIVAADRGTKISMSDVSQIRVPVAAAPTDSVGIADVTGVLRSPADAVHVGDDVPVRLIADQGDISLGNYVFAKQMEVIAGHDIRQASFAAQNTAPDQLSILQAGRDISLFLDSAVDGTNLIQLAGPGRLELLAGRSVNLGLAKGVTTDGAVRNANLPTTEGAAVDIWTGLAAGPDYAAFNSDYWGGKFGQELVALGTQLIPFVQTAAGQTGLTPDSVWTAYGALTPDQRSSYVASLDAIARIRFQSFDALLAKAQSYLAQATGAAVAPGQVADAYAGLALTQQRPLIEEYLFRELRDAGRLKNAGGDQDFAAGFAAINTLFPDSGTWAGNINMYYSQIYTLAGGDINLLMPGGGITAGLAQIPPDLPGGSKRASDLGIVAQGEGAVRVFSHGDVLVNQSRIFTLQGGDIVIWSSEGNIDAGRGAKSAISAPPPVVSVDSNGQVTVSFSDAIAGSGIRGILTRTDIAPGDVDLIAPKGEVNAGDAGIGSAGNLNIAAPQVVGLDNIQVGGVAAGVPSDTNVAAGLTGASSLGASASQSADSTAAGAVADKQAVSQADAALGWLDVFVEGFGDEDLKKKKVD